MTIELPPLPQPNEVQARQMDKTELETIESEEGVKFTLKPNGRIATKGVNAARALARIANHRAEVSALLRERQVAVEGEMVELEISSESVSPKEIQKENYVRWYQARGEYYTPSPEELDKMWAAVEENDVVHFDFAHSITVEKPNGRLVAIDRKGRLVPPSPYAPVMRKEPSK